MSKDLTKLSQKELESMLAKKYGVEKYLNQKSQLLGLLGTKGETDIETGFTGPETEALSIMFESSPAIGSRSKAEGGIVSLSLGSGEFDDTDLSDAGSFDSYDDLDTALDDSEDYQAGLQSMQQNVDDNPQLNTGMGKALIGDRIKELIAKGNTDVTRDEQGRITGVYSQGQMPGLVGALASLFGADTAGRVYTGYGKEGNIGMGSDDGDDTSQMIRKISQQKKEEKKDTPLTQAEIDYYTRGMGTATKPLKTLEDVNKHMASLVGTTASPTGAKLSKDKQFLVLPNGKIINLKTGKVQESMSGLELFRGGMI